jgi:phosphoribosyl 1,2-cyclic phosphodiesterase
VHGHTPAFTSNLDSFEQHSMSTFDGIVSEFPDIRIDYFRNSPNHPPPLACFLSHVHSDHLQGLESLKAPFVYCSPATKEVGQINTRFPISSLNESHRFYSGSRNIRIE